MECPLTISTIADRIIFQIQDGTKEVYFEVDQKTGHHINCALATAISRIGSGETVAQTLGELLDDINVMRDDQARII